MKQRQRSLILLSVLCGVTALLVGSPSALAFAEGEEYEPPRTSGGRPDFQGVWTNASLTRLGRPNSIEALVLSPADAEQLGRNHFHNVRAAKDAVPRAADREAPEKLERLPPVGNYNTSYVDPGTGYGIVQGEIRSSWVVEPSDGKVPYRPELLEQLRSRRASRTTPDDPEVFSLGERCLIGFGGTAGPPMLNVLYNNYYRIVQTDDHVMILVEMVHDARVIRIGQEHGPETEKRWLGDSVARWEGDTLVVETANFHPARARSGPVYHSAKARVVERLTRVADDELFYEFEVTDPGSYSDSFRGEMALRSVDAKVYEYACHEGNYAMPTMLKGARLEERETGSE
jgi:hypothetical protein